MIHVDERFCPKNHRCPAVTYCPQRAIVQETVFSAPTIDAEKCTGCALCTRVCRVFVQAQEPVSVG